MSTRQSRQPSGTPDAPPADQLPDNGVAKSPRQRRAALPAPQPSSSRQRLWQNLALIGVLMALLLGSAAMVVNQSFYYRQDYRTYTRLLHDKDDLDAEWGRLLIEQQTFGATSQIGTRAVMQLRMYSPPAAQTVVVASK